MLLLNHKMSAEEAVRFNFVSEVVPRAELDTKLWPKIDAFAKLPPQSLLATKRLLRKFETNHLQNALNDELDQLYKCFESEEFINALGNFFSRKSKL